MVGLLPCGLQFVAKVLLSFPLLPVLNLAARAPGMNGNKKAKRWRTFVLKIAALSLAWLLLATMFSLQFYWIGKDSPLQISWRESFVRALVEWCPWMILSPAVVWLAERCRFD